jgi:acyl dehydratase
VTGETIDLAVGDLAASTEFYEGRVDGDAAVAFALATNDRNDRYLRGEAVPPLFTVALILPANWEAQRMAVGLDSIRGARGSVHGEQDVFYWGAVKPGMPLRWQARTSGARQTRGGVAVTQSILITDADGAPLVEHLWSNFHIGATIDADFGDAGVDHTFPEEARTRLLGSRTVTVDRDQAFRYAGASGDRVGHSIDDDVARSEGYPSKILQGMCTFGLCSGAVVDVGAAGDTSRLRRLAARFSAPTFPGRDLVVRVYDAGPTAEGSQALAFEAIQDGVTVIKHGRAEFDPPA